MRICHISDSHNKHRKLKLPKYTEVDLIIHSGDITEYGSQEEIHDFFSWYKKLSYKYKIVIPGNHDKCFDEKFWNDKALRNDRLRQKLLGAEEWAPAEVKNFESKQGCYFLNHSSIEIEGINFFGSPWTPDFHPQYWAFNYNKKTGETIWDTIPLNTDVLITHGPPFGYGDYTLSGDRVGCDFLLKKIREVKPKYSLFGHIHEDNGIYSELFYEDTVVFLNSSVLTVYGQPIRPYHLFEI